MTTYYAICDCNGPISVRLEGDTEADAIEYFMSAEQDDGLGRDWIDEPRMDAEEDLGIDGYGMSEEEFDDAMRDAGAEPVRDLEPIVNAHAGTVAHLAGGWYLWRHNGG